ncbi:DNA alkylation repair protein [Paenibacillus sp. KQZ6P-2]|uniref:DNA alkylation repair protein n=1 Tax=Paenibacillus mangrovi TaxID=2931978 RepID=A0A9X2B5C7_9BACL|nr:DNA alkylation repair protein [Paenibacillus mangrovi]MCJ8014895.1 DNA alkylation repair protein [Paenibacillus mangrovi]
MAVTIREQLFELADEKYQKFSAALIPNVSNVLGVRLPELRKLAKHIAKGDWRTFLKEADNDYFEEIMLQGMVIGYVKADIDEKLRYTAAFVPKIDNWSVCDSFCTGLKFAKTEQDKMWEFLQPYLQSGQEYEIRFGIVMLLGYFIDEKYIDRVLQALDSIRHEGYYVKMAAAWALSICYIKLPEPTSAYFRNCSLDDFTFNKALQKITESNRIDLDTKKLIRSMKRKNVSQG